MVRSVWKGIWIDNDLKKYTKISQQKILTMSRSSVIIPYFLNKKIYVYNGKKYIGMLVNHQALGRKLGEFSFTRKIAKYNKKNKKKVKK